MTNSGSADETESEMRTRKTRQTACSRKRIWKACARQKSPRIIFEADLWKMLKNSTPWVWLEWIEFFSFFQHFSAFWKLMNAHFSKNSCYSRYSIINEWPHCGGHARTPNRVGHIKTSIIQKIFKKVTGQIRFAHLKKKRKEKETKRNKWSKFQVGCVLPHHRS